MAAETSRSSSSSRPQLLSDEQMLRFLATGWLSLPLAPTGDPLHEKILKRTETFGREGEHSKPHVAQPGLGAGQRSTDDPQEEWTPPFEVYNVHPRIPEMREAVLEHPVVCGALRSVLGDDYALNTHRSVCFAGTSLPAHKDTQRFPVIVHRPRTVYIFYLPAGATLEMGPTSIIPLSHWLSRDQGDHTGSDYSSRQWASVSQDPACLAPSLTQHLCTAPAHQGTAVLLHHAIFHRGTLAVRKGRSGAALPRRPMIKLIFHRTRAPTAPSWQHDCAFDFATPTCSAEDAARLAVAAGCTEPDLLPAIESVWRWLLGTSHSTPATPAEGQQELAQISTLSARLYQTQRDGDEAMRVGAGYQLANLARHSSDALRSLLEVLDDGPEAGRRVAVQALAGAGRTVVAPLTCRLQALLVQTQEMEPLPIIVDDAGILEEVERQQQVVDSLANCAVALGEAAAAAPTDSDSEASAIESAPIGALIAAIELLQQRLERSRADASSPSVSATFNPFGRQDWTGEEFIEKTACLCCAVNLLDYRTLLVPILDRLTLDIAQRNQGAAANKLLDFGTQEPSRAVSWRWITSAKQRWRAAHLGPALPRSTR